MAWEIAGLAGARKHGHVERVDTDKAQDIFSRELEKAKQV
jgi:hypothetical protein